MQYQVGHLFVNYLRQTDLVFSQCYPCFYNFDKSQDTQKRNFNPLDIMDGFNVISVVLIVECRLYSLAVCER